MNGSAAMAFCTDFVNIMLSSLKKLPGEGLDCPDYTDFLETILKPLLGEYESNDIYNANETSFFYKALANRMYAFSAETVRGSKYVNSKDRLSLMLCTNMTGTDKMPPLIIGKAVQPHSLQRNSIGLSDSKVDYYNNSNGWMTAVVFEHWLGKWNDRLVSKSVTFFFWADSAPLHITKEYSIIRVQYLLPNTTSKLQPLDQGIICVCKMKYCCIMTGKLCHLMDIEEDIKKVMLGFDFVTAC